MKYIITRTSGWRDEKPVETAHLEEVHEYDHRRKPRENECFPWYEEFVKSCHDIVEDDNGGLRGICNKPTEVWVDEIEDLHKFVEQHGRIILNEPDCEEGLWSVEIYDDYRE